MPRRSALVLISWLAVACSAREGLGPQDDEQYRVIEIGPCVFPEYWPDFFLYTNDGTTWTRVESGDSSAFRIRVGSLFGIAYGKYYSTTVLFLGAADVQDLRCSRLTPEVDDIRRIAASGPRVPSGDVVEIFAGTQGWFFTPGDSVDAIVTDRKRFDIVAFQAELQPQGGIQGSRVKQMMLRRGVPITATDPVAFPSVDALAPETTVVDVEEPRDGEQREVALTFWSAGGTGADIPQGLPIGAQFNMLVVPRSMLAAGDSYRLKVALTAPSSQRTVTATYVDAPSIALGFGAELAQPTISTSALVSGEKLYGFSLPVQEDYGRLLRAQFRQPNGSAPATMHTIIASRAYLGSTVATWNFTMPDFSSLDVGFRPFYGTTLDWTITAWDDGLEAIYFPDSPPLDLKMVHSASQSGHRN